MSQEWEYLAHSMQYGYSGGTELGGEMAHLGEDGWELVSVVGIDKKHCVAFFKRPKR